MLILPPTQKVPSSSSSPLGGSLSSLSPVYMSAAVSNCLNNNKQLLTAALMYTGDSDDKLPPNGDDDDDGTFWVGGNMSIAADARNTSYLTDPRYASLAPYVKQAADLYKCPGDKSTVQVGGVSYSRVRTYSMNAAVGTLAGSSSYRSGGPVWGLWLDGTGHHTP